MTDDQYARAAILVVALACLLLWALTGWLP